MKIIVTHKNSDFDAFASLIAAKILYPDAIPILPHTVRQNVKNFISIHKDYLKVFSANDIIGKAQIDTIIVVDTNSWKRVEKGDELKKDVNKTKKIKKAKVIIWDHHKKENIEADEEHIKKIGSTTTMLVDEIKRKQKKISKIEATLFLMGIYEDTGFLSFLSTTPQDVLIAGYLFECGADLSVLNNFLSRVYNEEQNTRKNHTNLYF